MSDEELHQMNLKKQEDNETLSYGRFHIVNEEETFEDIARERGISVTDLLAWNNLSTEDTLEIGLQLKLTAPKEKRWISHEVKSYESLNIIAKKYNVRVEDIQKWNVLESKKVATGTTLWLHVAID